MEHRELRLLARYVRQHGFPAVQLGLAIVFYVPWTCGGRRGCSRFVASSVHQALTLLGY